MIRRYYLTTFEEVNFLLNHFYHNTLSVTIFLSHCFKKALEVFMLKEYNTGGMLHEWEGKRSKGPSGGSCEFSLTFPNTKFCKLHPNDKILTPGLIQA